MPMGGILKAGNRVINMAHVALIERGGNGDLTIHLALAQAGVPAGITYPYGPIPPGATDHRTEVFRGQGADDLWNKFKGL